MLVANALKPLTIESIFSIKKIFERDEISFDEKIYNNYLIYRRNENDKINEMKSNKKKEIENAGIYT